MLKLFIVLFSCYTVMCREINMNCKPDEEIKWIHVCPGETTCRDRDHPPLCPDILQPQLPVCACKDGLIRADDGSCVTSEQCDKLKCPDPNEHYKCGYVCENECAALNVPDRTDCPDEHYLCKRECYCNDGYARDENGVCIPVGNCGMYNRFL
ncbi:unnamed protein product [Chrysodeixis includens]|uniref:TIL domain-containing protein n=1 Tax=Chrysodeixis includens TaxID=689277 RepID=A0A9N8L2Z3_CHRIL|nr:unnamed protein product [Chrysodeixis includens]